MPSRASPTARTWTPSRTSSPSLTHRRYHHHRAVFFYSHHQGAGRGPGPSVQRADCRGSAGMKVAVAVFCSVSQDNVVSFYETRRSLNVRTPVKSILVCISLGSNRLIHSGFASRAHHRLPSLWRLHACWRRPSHWYVHMWLLPVGRVIIFS